MARCGVRVDSCRSYVEVLLDLRFRLLLRRGSRRCSAIRRQLVEVQYYTDYFIRTPRGPSRLDVLSWSSTNQQGQAARS